MLNNTRRESQRRLTAGSHFPAQSTTQNADEFHSHAINVRNDIVSHAYQKEGFQKPLQLCKSSAAMLLPPVAECGGRDRAANVHEEDQKPIDFAVFKQNGAAFDTLLLIELRQPHFRNNLEGDERTS
jgi:hypothetical protein